MKRKGCSIIFINDQNQVLLFQRDDIPTIPYPGMWDVPGGHVEKGETPEGCIVREMEEEMGMQLEEFHLFSITEFDDRIEYTFWKRDDLDIEKLELTEGQCLRWFTKDEVGNVELAYGFEEIINDFYRKAPFL